MVNTNDTNFSEKDLDRIFSALSDSTRRAMLARLADHEMSVKELSEPFPISKPAITKHLKVLERTGLLKRLVNGREHRCRLEAAPIQRAALWIQFYERFWHEKLDSLDAFFRADKDRQ